MVGMFFLGLAIFGVMMFFGLKFILSFFPPVTFTIITVILCLVPFYVYVRHFIAKKGIYLPSFSELGIPLNGTVIFLFGVGISYFLPIVGIVWLASIVLYGIYAFIAKDVSLSILLKKI